MSQLLNPFDFKPWMNLSAFDASWVRRADVSIDANMAWNATEKRLFWAWIIK